MAMSKERSELVKSSETYEEVSNPCQPCSFHGKVISSDRFCIDCQEYMCRACMMHHTASKASRNHKLVAADQAKKASPKVVKDKCSMKCTVHRDKTVKYFCKTHTYLGCSVCMTVNHKQCNDVIHIPTFADDIKSNDDYKKFDEKLKAIEAACKAGMADVKKNLKATETDHEQLKEAMHEFKKQVIGALDKLENEIMTKAGGIMREETTKLDDLSKKLSKHQSDTDAMIKQADTLLSSGKNCDLYIFTKNEAKTLVALGEELNGMLRGHQRRRYEFQPNIDTLKTIASGKLGCQREGSSYSSAVAALDSPIDGDAMAKLLKVGTRVRRGKDWRCGNQDGGGLGTIIKTPSSEYPWYKVKWDNGHTQGYTVNSRVCLLQIA